MNQDDPFAPFINDDETILRPNPGGNRNTGAGPTRSVPPSMPAREIPVPDFQLDAYRQSIFDDNPLIAAALPLFSLVSRLRNLATHTGIPELQKQLIGEIRNFENRVIQLGISQEQARIASYALCSLLDETVLGTPWGAQSFWVHQSLLVIFHKDAWGGEKFFEFQESLVSQPARNLHLIEFFWLCLSLGFKGKYAVRHNGLNILEQTRTELYQLVQRIRGDCDRELSIHWQGIRDLRNPLIRYVPLWVVGSAAALLLLIVYLGFAYVINGASDPVSRDLYVLTKLEVKPSLPPPPVPPKVAFRAERFKRILAQEIAENRVDVVDDRILRLRDSFASGSDQIKPAFLPILDKVAKELGTGHDAVLINGHTDDKPIFNARFPSNFDLSVSRAQHVLALLRKFAAFDGPAKCEGRADFEPLVPNDSEGNRALNRRVDILIQ